MKTPAYRYVLDIESHDERPLGRVPVTPDFEALERCACFEASRREHAVSIANTAAARVLPVWDDVRGEPFVAALRVEVDGVAAASASPERPDEVSIEFFRPLAERAVAAWIEAGRIRAGEHFVFSVCAFPVDPARPGDADGLAVEAAPRVVAIEQRPLAGSLAASRSLGPDSGGAFPVFVAPTVVADAIELAHSAAERESGGVLVGRLCRSLAEPELFLEVTGLIPARHASATSGTFTFSSETWSAAHAALALRRSGEVLVGWMHSHPFFCRACPAERRRDCAFGRPLFSRDDIHLHRTCFPAPYQVALLISDLGPAGYAPTFYGWRHGRVGERGVRVLDEQEVSRCEAVAIPN